MNAVWAYCRNGDRHFGHLYGWGEGFAVIGGTRVDGVVFIDAAPIESGGFMHDDMAGSAPGDGDAQHSVAVPAALPYVTPTGRTSLLPGAGSDGQGKPVGVPLYGCRCGHSRHDHGPYAHCRRTGCLCDSYRSATSNAAGHAGPAAL